MSESIDQYVKSLLPHLASKLTGWQLIRNVTLPLQQWHSFFYSKGRSPKPSDTSNGRQNYRGRRERSSTPSHTPKQQEPSLKCKRNTRNLLAGCREWAVVVLQELRCDRDLFAARLQYGSLCIR